MPNVDIPDTQTTYFNYIKTHTKRALHSAVGSNENTSDTNYQDQTYADTAMYLSGTSCQCLLSRIVSGVLMSSIQNSGVFASQNK